MNSIDMVETKSPSLAELKAVCRENKIKGFSGLNKASLRELITKHSVVEVEVPEVKSCPSPVEELPIKSPRKKVVVKKDKKSKAK